MSRGIVVAAEPRAQLDDLGRHRGGGIADDRVSVHERDRRPLETLRHFPSVGASREDILPGLRTIGFRRRVTIAFMVVPDAVLVVGIFYGGQDFETMLRDE